MLAVVGVAVVVVASVGCPVGRCWRTSGPCVPSGKKKSVQPARGKSVRATGAFCLCSSATFTCDRPPKGCYSWFERKCVLQEIFVARAVRT